MQRPPPSKRKPAPGLQARALRLLARREHTRRELAAKLAPHAEDPQVLEAVLDEITQHGWLSEERVVEQALYRAQARLGPARVRRDLQAKGVSPDRIGRAVRALEQNELDAARAVWSRKYSHSGTTPAEQAKQIRFLCGRGFSAEVAARVVRGRFESSLTD